VPGFTSIQLQEAAITSTHYATKNGKKFGTSNKIFCDAEDFRNIL
jgi:hypothetical protein